MRRVVLLCILALIVTVSVLAIAGCDKEKIVNTTDTVRETEYVELPPDTVFVVDTVMTSDSVTVEIIDTVVVMDTVVQVEQVYDTILIQDTITEVNTVYDTVVQTQYVYDTTVIVDTVSTGGSSPNEFLAYTALEYYTDQIVIADANSQLGVSDGWVFYLSAHQSDRTARSADVYDIYGYIDFWTPDWTEFLAYEYYWRMTYLGGDPADPQNWDISEPPAASGERQSGLQVISSDPTEVRR